MGLYAALLRQGLGPKQVDDTDLEDFMTMLDNEGSDQPKCCIDEIMS